MTTETTTSMAPLEARLPLRGTSLDGDQLLERFLEYTEELGLEMYPAQEEAVLEIFAGHNVVLKTPTGSGKSLVALAACFKALADEQFAFYTAPIKALVTEKFFELCKILGPRNVGMMTGDASVNRDAPVLCCTAEILANLALREGKEAQADWIVMDEFHYYSDRDRGVAWQVPLLTLTNARFLLMSATMGKPEFFVDELAQRTKAPATLVQSDDRPVPLDWEYSEVPLQEVIETLVEKGKVPIYIVHFSQRAASEQAQNLMSLNFTSKEDKQRLKAELKGFRFDSPFGKELARYVMHGIGVHHAGMLPKYRRLNERLAQQGLLRIICGTDTLGVGVNVPIRTVLFTQLCKFNGSKVVILPVRDFQQIAGRAGRRGFDTEGSVVVQAPEHVIENKTQQRRAEGNAKKQKKLRLKKAPERGYKAWDAETLERLRTSEPEPLVSRFQLSYGLLLDALSGPGGCTGARAILRECHESKARKRTLLREGIQMFRSLLDAEILEISGGQVQIHSDLQQDFSLNHALSLYAVGAFDALDPNYVAPKPAEASDEEPGEVLSQGASPGTDHALVLLSIIEAILENPTAILYRQENVLKTRCVNTLKAEGVEYDERMEALEKVEYPKPESEFIYNTFRTFAEHHPWVAGHSIAPKSIVRDMRETASSFNDYVKEYGLARSEGVLLRYLSDCYRVLRQTVPEKHKTEEVKDIEEWLGAELRRVDASLIREWERLEAGEDQYVEDEPTEPEQNDITQDPRSFLALARNAAFRLVQSLSAKNHQRFISALTALGPDDTIHPKKADGTVWSAESVAEAMGEYWTEHDVMLTDGDARSQKRLTITGQNTRQWSFLQTLSDPDENHDWGFVLRIDMDASALSNRVVATLEALGTISAEPSSSGGRPG